MSELRYPQGICTKSRLWLEAFGSYVFNYNGIVFTGHNLDILRAHGCCFICRTDCSEWIDSGLTELAITNVRLENEVIPTAVVCPDCTSGQLLFERKKNAIITGACI